MRRICLSLARFVGLSALAAALSLLSLRTVPALRRSVLPQSPSPAGPTLHAPTPFASLATADPFAFYANLRHVGQFWVTDPTLCPGGAKGDDSSDDTACFSNADAAAQAAHGEVVIPSPPGGVAYKVTSQFTLRWPAKWHGFTSNMNDTIIRAHGSPSTYRAIIDLQSEYCPTCSGSGSQVEDIGSARADLSDFTLDANLTSGALHGLLINSTENSHFRIRSINATGACIRSANNQQAYNLGSVTCAGTCTAGSVTVGQPDPEFGAPQLIGTSPVTVKVKVSTGGTRGPSGAAQYVVSYDGGATYATVALPIEPVVNLTQQDGVNVQALLGLQVHFPAGTYTLNDVYTFTVTGVAGIYGQVQAGSTQNLWDQPQLGQCGTTYATADQVPFYGSFTLLPINGTLSTTTGSDLFTFSGSPGLMSVIGAGVSYIVLQTNSQVFQGLIVDDDHVVITDNSAHDLAPTFTLSGLGYSFGTFGGYYDDGQTEGPYAVFEQGNVGFSSICLNIKGAHGPVFTGFTNLNSCALAGLVLGGGSLDQAASSILTRVHYASTSAVHHGAPLLFSPFATGTSNNPAGNVSFQSRPLSWIHNIQGTFTPLTPTKASSFLPLGSMQLVASSISISSPTFQFPAPDTVGPSGNTSFAQIRISGPSVTLTSSPTIPDPTIPGIVYVIQNLSSASQLLCFQDNTTSGSGLTLESNKVCIAPTEAIWFVSTGPFFGPKWQEVTVQKGYGFFNPLGNTGHGRATIKTTTTASTNLWSFLADTTATAPGTLFRFFVRSESQLGVNVGYWEGLVGYDSTATRFAWIVDHQIGTGSGGSIPLGWTLTSDAAGSGSPKVANLKFTGDNSGNTVVTTIDVQHEDPGQ